MERKESSRHLAAILFTDIVGYTSMMQRDEKLALSSVRKHQEILERTIPLHEGEIYQYYGDGSLSIFSSATNALKCAYELQKQMLSEPRVLLRTGIHIGEIYSEGGKIFGDGVNVASRIESMGQGGTVLFSRDVYEKVRNHTHFQIKHIGSFEFKNVEDPVQIYALTNPGIITPDGKFVEGKLKEQKKKSYRTVASVSFLGLIVLALAYFFINKGTMVPKDNWEVKKSVAVLPFKNLNGSSDEDFLSTGIAEDILVQLAQIKDLKVIAQSSSLRIKDADKDLRKIAQDLGVTSLLDGTIQRYENNLRVSVRLIKASDESIIWAHHFDEKFEDILNMQRNVALAVSEHLKVSLTPQTKTRLEDRVNVDPEAYVNYQKGQELLKRSSGTKEDMDQARKYFEMSIREDSTFSLAWVGLADAWIETLFWHRNADEDALPQARRAAMKAVALDPENGECYGVLGAISLMERKLSEAETNLHKSIELNPNYSFAYERLAWTALIRGNDQEAVERYEQVILLDPLSTRLKGSLANMYYFRGRFEEGVERMRAFLRLDPTDNFLLWSLAYCYAGNGDYQKAIETLRKRTIGTETNWIYAYCYAKLGKKEDAQSILDYHLERKKTGHVPDFMMAVIYASLGEQETALDYLEKSMQVAGENWFVLGLDYDPMLDPLRKHPRFKSIVQSVYKAYGI
jgi:TolB-like protein/class 3 adenylate cyclase/Flp pilus assembly protein TadD